MYSVDVGMLCFLTTGGPRATAGQRRDVITDRHTALAGSAPLHGERHPSSHRWVHWKVRVPAVSPLQHCINSGVARNFWLVGPWGVKEKFCRGTVKNRLKWKTAWTANIINFLGSKILKVYFCVLPSFFFEQFWGRNPSANGASKIILVQFP